MRGVSIFALIATLLLIGCAAPAVGHSASVLDTIEHADVEPVEFEVSALLLELSTIPVELDSAEPFHTIARKDAIVKYPCSSCHAAPLTASETRSDAHWDIELNHADAEVMSCTTCHTADNLDTLHTLTDKPVDFDNSYTVCAQCHNMQVADWAGGAHGKRVGGWTPPRVVENCITCHNPHDPAWDTRWPATTGGGIQAEE